MSKLIGFFSSRRGAGSKSLRYQIWNFHTFIQQRLGIFYLEVPN
jgi:hypothetical protein